MHFEVSAKRPAARRDKACAARLALAPAKPAPPSTRSAPLTVNASHRRASHALGVVACRSRDGVLESRPVRHVTQDGGHGPPSCVRRALI
ncbi:hypothetical protein CKY51_14505 [Xanthomonas maliensis]|nr:hypothetical protein CKY51_14505 [Xanthomonas maliensis]